MILSHKSQTLSKQPHYQKKATKASPPLLTKDFKNIFDTEGEIIHDISTDCNRLSVEIQTEVSGSVVNQWFSIITESMTSLENQCDSIESSLHITKACNVNKQDINMS
jgi:hypothetical protein